MDFENIRRLRRAFLLPIIIVCIIYIVAVILLIDESIYNRRHLRSKN